MDFRITEHDTVYTLQDHLRVLRNCYISPNEEFILHLKDVFISSTVLSLLVEVLNQPLPRKRNDEDRKWDLVDLRFCSIDPRPEGRPHTRQITRDERYCSADDMCVLFSTLMSRTRRLILRSHSCIVESLTRIPQLDRFEVASLEIDPGILSADDYSRLGDMIQRSTRLTRLQIDLPFDKDALPMLERLANTTTKKGISLSIERLHGEKQLSLLLSLFFGKDGNGLVLRLLQNPWIGLQDLVLNELGLEDYHFVAFVQALPAYHLRKLDVGNNNIQCRAIIEFAKQLPNIQSLKSITLEPNPWWPDTGRLEYSEQVESCFAALVEGMMGNFSVEEFHGFSRLIKFSKVYPRIQILIHFLDLNRAGRRILATAASIPMGLWPHVLEWAGRTIDYKFCHPTDQPARRANAVYFMLQNCLIFCHKNQLIFHPRDYDVMEYDSTI